MDIDMGIKSFIFKTPGSNIVKLTWQLPHYLHFLGLKYYGNYRCIYVVAFLSVFYHGNLPIFYGNDSSIVV
jgi:hypothetical protein